MDFTSFLLKAKRAAYPRGKYRKVGAFNVFEYSEGNFSYSDVYTGHNPFSGTEIVYYNSVAIWSMHYYGFAYLEEAFTFLKRALKPSEDALFRGPPEVKLGEFLYVNKWKGDVRLFKGTEKIYRYNKKVYTLDYFGGINLPEFLDLRALRSRLKKPLGKLFSIEDLIKLKNKKIIAVGDEVTYSLIERGVKPFVAVYDFKTLRKRIQPNKRRKILSSCPPSFLIDNKPGFLNTSMFYMAKLLIKKGGYVKVKGEEDLLTLAFVPYIKNHVLVYGQPDEGIVVVDKKKALKVLLEVIPLFP